MSIKEDAELQHVLGHIWLALEHLANDQNKAALYELDSIEALIFFDGPEDRVDYLERIDYGKAEPLQGSTTEETGEAEAEEEAKDHTPAE